MVGACTGVSLKPSVVTGILDPVLTGIVNPLQAAVNPILGLPLISGLITALGGSAAPANIQLGTLLSNAASGQPIRLSVLDNNGTLLGPGAACNTQTDSLQLTTPAGISIGGNRITGLGANNQDAVAGEIGSIAFGNNASTNATAVNAIAIGTGATVAAGASGAIAQGFQARANGANSIAIGSGAVTGSAVDPTRVAEVAIGNNAAATAQNSVAIGDGATASGVQGTAIGSLASATGSNSTAVGRNALAGNSGVALGTTAQATALHGTALGQSAQANVADATSVGFNASVTAANSVALGSGSVAARGATTGSVGEVSVGAVGATRQITNVAAGTAATDAANVSQLANATANAVEYDTVGGVRTNSVTLSGGAAGTVAIRNVTPGALTAGSTDAVNGSQLFATNGQVTTNTTNIAGNTTAITNINNGTTGIVRQVGGVPSGVITVGAQTAGTVVDVTGTAGTRTVTGVTAGAVTAASTDAVNGGQLFTTNGQVATNTANIVTNTTNIAANTGNIATNTTNITANTNSIAGNTTSITALNTGTAGLVLQDGGAPGGGAITVGALTGGTNVSIAALGGGTRVLSGVSAGVAATDAVNVSQLGAVGAASANAVQYDTIGGVRTNTVTLSGGLAGPVTIANVAPGALTALSTDAVNGAQLFTTNGLVATNTTNIATNTGDILTNTANITANTTLIAGNTTSITALNNGTAGLVQQAGGAPSNNPITVGALTGGTNVSFAGLQGTRVLSGVSAGVAATDAVNVSQLGAVGAVSANSVQYDTLGGVRTNTVTLAGGIAGPVIVTNVAPGALNAASTDAVNGAQLFATNELLGTNTINIAGNTTAITNLSIGIGNGSLGLVRQVGGAPGIGVITIGAETSGDTVSVASLTGTRVVGGVSAGVADTDAVNVGQLASLGTTVSNSVQYDTVGGVRTNTVTLTGGAAGPVTVTNVGAGAVTAASTDAVNGAQLFATNTQVTTNTTNIAGNTTAITNLTTSINNGSTGLVQQTGGAPGNGQITVGATTGGTSVSVTGTGGDRVITGVANGLAANDAATVGQLAQVTGGAFNAVNYDTDAGGGRLNSITLAGGAAGPVGISNLADGLVAAGSTAAVTGNQLAATNANVTSNTTAIANNTTTINAVVNGQAGAFRSNNTANAAAPVATGANATAGGFGASATASRGVALGNGATSTGINSVSLGAGSSDGGVANVVSVGSVGSERRITNVGPALSGTDAVNLSQLQAAQATFGATTSGLQSQINDINFDIGKAKRDSRAATAGAMAVAALPQAFSPGAGMIGGGIGNWRGEYAFAIGASKIIGDQTVFKAGVSYNTRGSGGFNAGVGYQF